MKRLILALCAFALVTLPIEAVTTPDTMTNTTGTDTVATPTGTSTMVTTTGTSTMATTTGKGTPKPSMIAGGTTTGAAPAMVASLSPLLGSLVSIFSYLLLH